MKARVLILFALLCAALAPAAVVDTIKTTGDSCSVLVDSTGKEPAKSCKSVSIFQRADVFTHVTVGVSAPAISINAKTGGVGFLSSIDPVTVTYNGVQRLWARSSEVHRMALWTVSAGLSISKADSSSFSIGATLVPWGIRVDSYQFGIGVHYSAQDALEWKLRRISIVIPITYSL